MINWQINELLGFVEIKKYNRKPSLFFFFDKQYRNFINNAGEGVVTYSNNQISSDQLQAQKSNEEVRDLKLWLCV